MIVYPFGDKVTLKLDIQNETFAPVRKGFLRPTAAVKRDK